MAVGLQIAVLIVAGHPAILVRKGDSLRTLTIVSIIGLKRGSGLFRGSDLFLFFIYLGTREPPLIDTGWTLSKHSVFLD